MKFEVEINTSEKGFSVEFDTVQTVEPIVEPLEVTENGTYTAPDGVTGYTPVTVNVVPKGEITITENGVHDVSDYASAVVNVKLVSDVDALIDGSITEISSQAATVRKYAFYNITNLENAIFPNATTIGESAFEGCSTLKKADFPKATIVGRYAFNNCASLVDVIFPVAERIVSSAFYKCTAIKEVTFPKATHIEIYGLRYCTALKKVDLPSLVDTARQTFADCPSLTILILRNTNAVVQVASSNILSNTPIASGTGYIYVPAALIDSYKAASGWSTYAAQFRALEDYTVDGTVTGALDESKI